MPNITFDDNIHYTIVQVMKNNGLLIEEASPQKFKYAGKNQQSILFLISYMHKTFKVLCTFGKLK